MVVGEQGWGDGGDGDWGWGWRWWNPFLLNRHNLMSVNYLDSYHYLVVNNEILIELFKKSAL